MFLKAFFVFILVTRGFHDLMLLNSVPVIDGPETGNKHLISDSLHQTDDGLEPDNDYSTTDITAEEKLEDTYSYVAAVLEYAPNTDVDGGLEIIISNAQSYIVFAQEAKNVGADIIVFPEYGLTGGLPILPATMLPYTQAVPDPSDALVPCDFQTNDTSTQALMLLSCAAHHLKLYLVVDLAEQVTCDECSTGHHFYNTQIVFDRQGTIIARYRKRNLFGEVQFHPGPEEPDTAIFTTDFGVTFSLQVCFDILYEYPGVVNVVERGVKHVAMSTAWMDQLPSLTAPQMQSAWAESLGINLLVANIHHPAAGFTGSGIYPGDTDLEHLYTYDSQGSRLVIMTVTNNNAKPNTKRGALNLQTNSQEYDHQHLKNAENGFFSHEKSIDSDKIFNGTNTIEETQSFSDPITNDVKNISKVSIIEDDDNQHKFKYEDLSKYSHFSLNKTNEGEIITQRLCHNEEFCCNINYTWPVRESNITYMLLAFDGLQSHAGGVYKTYYQVCSILHCSEEDVLTCAHVDTLIPQSNSLKVQSLEGLFETPYVYPSVLKQDLTLAKRNVWSFDNTKMNSNSWRVAVHVDKGDELHQLLALTLFGRIYDRDP